MCIRDSSNVITFGKVGEEWLQFKLKNAFNDLPRCGVLQLAERCLQQDIYPDLQDLPFQNIKRYDLVSVIKKIEGRQVKEPVKKACSYLNQIYDYAVAMGYCCLLYTSHQSHDDHELPHVAADGDPRR